ncbi:MAG: hypothetical protein WA160_04365 [Pseudobdellovibrio sp.]
MFHKYSYLFFVAACFFSILVGATEPTSKPRVDLYNRIKKETGVSLKEAFKATQGKNQLAVNSLESYTKRVGIKEIERSFDEEIANRERYCKKKKTFSCDGTVEDLKLQIALIRDQNNKMSSLEGFKKLYFYLVVYQFNIKFTVLKDDLLDWDKNCSSQEKINTIPCQEKLYEAHVLADMARDVGQIALQKSEKVQVDVELSKLLEERILRYEK